MDSKDRRRYPRIYSPAEIKCNFENEFFSDYTMCLSLGGAYVKTSRQLEEGSILSMDLTLPDFIYTFNVKGEVIWNKTEEDEYGPPGIGIKFIDAREEDKEALYHYLVEATVTQLEV